MTKKNTNLKPMDLSAEAIRPLIQKQLRNSAWHYDVKGRVFDMKVFPRYPIPLERCLSAPEVLDWIMQVAGKSWANERLISDLVLTLRFYLQPQATLCSFGVDTGPIPLERAAQLAEELARFVGEESF